MPPELPQSTLILLASAVVLAGAFVQACSGFGFAMFAAPLLTLFLPHQQVPPLVVMLSLLSNITVLSQVWGHLRYGLVGRLLLGALPGLPLGVLLLRAVDVNTFKVVLGVLVAFTAVAMLAGWRSRRGRRLFGLLLAGFLSGTLSTGSSLSGPPIILSLANHDMPKDQFRANLLAFFLALNVLTILTFLLWPAGEGPAAAKLLDAGVFRLWLLPALFGGTALGLWLIRRVDEQRFRHAVLILLAALGVAIVALGLAG